MTKAKATKRTKKGATKAVGNAAKPKGKQGAVSALSAKGKAITSRSHQPEPPVREEHPSKPSVDVTSHVLIRVRSEDGRTFRAHKDMIVAKGSAVFGKIGQGLGPDFIDALNTQIAQGVDTFLFLSTREGWNGPYVAYQCRLKRVEAELPEAKLPLVPRYYSSDYDKVKTWFEISSLDKMSKWDMNRIYVLSSGRHIMSVIKSSAAVFRVGLNPPSKPQY